MFVSLSELVMTCLIVSIFSGFIGFLIGGHIKEYGAMKEELREMKSDGVPPPRPGGGIKS